MAEDKVQAERDNRALLKMLASVDRMSRLVALTDAQFADELERFWVHLPLNEPLTDLLSEAIDRIRRADGPPTSTTKETKSMADQTDTGGSLARIREAQNAVDAARCRVSDAKETLKAARGDLSAKLSALQDIIRAETAPMPLWDHAEAQAAREAAPPPSLEDLLAQESDADAAEQAAAAAADEAWRRIPLGDALAGLPTKALQCLWDAGLRTVGDFSDHTSQHPLTSIKGIGEQKAAQIEDAFEAFWARHLWEKQP
jgi:hypothetical protein